jgi:hypothetical protein
LSAVSFGAPTDRNFEINSFVLSFILLLQYLDARKEETSIMTDLSEREMLQEWMENKKYSREDILAGKSFIINTIVSYMRRMFDDNGVVHVVASTVMTSFNVLGETLDMFAGLDWRNTKKGMTNSTMEKLQNKLQNTVAIIMDERSMLSQIILGLV